MLAVHAASNHPKPERERERTPFETHRANERPFSVGTSAPKVQEFSVSPTVVHALHVRGEAAACVARPACWLASCAPGLRGVRSGRAGWPPCEPAVHIWFGILHQHGVLYCLN